MSSHRYAMQAELVHLIGRFDTPQDCADKLDALNAGITHHFKRDAIHGHIVSIRVDYPSLPQVYRDDMLTIGITPLHLA